MQTSGQIKYADSNQQRRSIIPCLLTSPMPAPNRSACKCSRLVRDLTRHLQGRSGSCVPANTGKHMSAWKVLSPYIDPISVPATQSIASLLAGLASDTSSRTSWKQMGDTVVSTGDWSIVSSLAGVFLLHSVYQPVQSTSDSLVRFDAEYPCTSSAEDVWSENA